MEPDTDDAFFDAFLDALEDARAAAARRLDVIMVDLYWRIGRELQREERQCGATWRRYAPHLVDALAGRMTARFGAGFDAAALRTMQAFYLAFPAGSTVPAESRRATSRRYAFAEAPRFPENLSWMHYLVLLAVDDEQVRSWYERQASFFDGSADDLARHVGRRLYQRLGKNRDIDVIFEQRDERQRDDRSSDGLEHELVLAFLGR